MEKIKRVSVTDTAMESIKELIASGKIGIGEKLPTEASLCDELGVSRTCVREAIRMLQAQGFVEIRPGKGAFVMDYKSVQNKSHWYDVDNSNFDDFLETRIAIECLAVRLAAQRATKENIETLKKLQVSFVEAHRDQEISRLVLLDETFHLEIAKYSKNQFIYNISVELSENFRSYRLMTFSSPDNYSNAIEFHQKIIESIEKRDKKEAEALMVQHLDITSSDFHRIVDNKS